MLDDPSNNIIKPPLKRQSKFYILRETTITDTLDMIGNNIDFQFVNKELFTKINKPFIFPCKK